MINPSYAKINVGYLEVNKYLNIRRGIETLETIARQKGA